MTGRKTIKANRAYSYSFSIGNAADGMACFAPMFMRTDRI